MIEMTIKVEVYDLDRRRFAYTTGIYSDLGLSSSFKESLVLDSLAIGGNEFAQFGDENTRPLHNEIKFLDCLRPILRVYSSDNTFLGVTALTAKGWKLCTPSDAAFWHLNKYPLYLDSIFLVADKGSDGLLENVLVQGTTKSILAIPTVGRYISGALQSILLYNVRTNRLLYLPVWHSSYNNDNSSVSIQCDMDAVFANSLKTFQDASSDIINLRVNQDEMIIVLSDAVCNPYELAGCAEEYQALSMLYPGLDRGSICLKDNISTLCWVCPRFAADIEIQDKAGYDILKIYDAKRLTPISVYTGLNCRRQIKLFNSNGGTLNINKDPSSFGVMLGDVEISVPDGELDMVSCRGIANVRCDLTRVKQLDLKMIIDCTVVARQSEFISLTGLKSCHLAVENIDQLELDNTALVEETRVASLDILYIDWLFQFSGTAGTLVLDRFRCTESGIPYLRLHQTYGDVVSFSVIPKPDFRLVLDLTYLDDKDITFRLLTGRTSNCSVKNVCLLSNDDFDKFTSRYPFNSYDFKQSDIIDFYTLSETFASTLANIEIRTNPGTTLTLELVTDGYHAGSLASSSEYEDIWDLQAVLDDLKLNSVWKMKCKTDHEAMENIDSAFKRNIQMLSSAGVQHIRLARFSVDGGLVRV